MKDIETVLNGLGAEIDDTWTKRPVVVHEFRAILG